jgi:hypothetical protein
MTFCKTGVVAQEHFSGLRLQAVTHYFLIRKMQRLNQKTRQLPGLMESVFR